MYWGVSAVRGDRASVCAKSWRLPCQRTYFRHALLLGDHKQPDFVQSCSRRVCLESRAAHNGPLYPKVGHNGFEVAQKYRPPSFQDALALVWAWSQASREVSAQSLQLSEFNFRSWALNLDRLRNIAKQSIRVPDPK